jgi:hypothetical protein
VGQCGRQSPHATQRLASAMSVSTEKSGGRSEGFMIISAEQNDRRPTFVRTAAHLKSLPPNTYKDKGTLHRHLGINVQDKSDIIIGQLMGNAVSII